MQARIIKTENNGFKDNEIDFLTIALTEAISKLELEVQQDKWFELVKLENFNNDSDAMMIVNLKKVNDKRQWTGEVFSGFNYLKIVAI